MCIACLEYIKDSLNADELKFALREMTVEDAAHRAEVERLMRELAGNPEELKKKLRELVQAR
jgi:hypothetical protein